MIMQTLGPAGACATVATQHASINANTKTVRMLTSWCQTERCQTERRQTERCQTEQRCQTERCQTENRSQPTPRGRCCQTRALKLICFEVAPAYESASRSRNCSRGKIN